MKLADLVATSAAVAQTPGRNAKRAELAACLLRLEPGEVTAGVHYLSGTLPQGRIGVGPALLRRCATGPAAPASTLEIAGLERALDNLAGASGRGVAAVRHELLQTLFARATTAERRFLIALLLGELRQGASEGIMIEAIAKAWQVASSEVRRAFMLSGDLAATASIAAAAGEAGLRQVRLRVGTPLRSMLAQTADSLDDVFERLDHAAQPLILDWKMDGARVQVHKDGDDVAVFSRRLNDVSASVPEVVEAVRSMSAPTLVLDGEAIVLAATGRPQPFQTTMRRFGRRQDVEAMRAALPLSMRVFDCLHADGEDLIGASCAARLRRLDAAVPAGNLMPRCVTDQPATAAAFLRDALASGHEGVMAKHPSAPYQAGGRGAAWLKVKHSHTLDLVVLAAEWGSGRRRGWLSNLHLGARDDAGGFVMLGKTFKGLTDALLKWQTEALLELAVERSGPVVHVVPKLVVEIAFNDVQTSPHYPGGVALRFARVKRYRPDKTASDADTLATVRALLP